MKGMYIIAVLLAAVSALMAYAVIHGDTYNPAYATRLAIAWAVLALLVAGLALHMQKLVAKR